MTRTAGRLLRPVAFAAAAAFFVAALGGLMTDLGPWYRGLAKPDWQPPDWVFGPAWTLIYTLTASAAVLAWLASESRVSRQNLLIILLINAILNVLWSLLFFRLQRPDWALAELLFFWASIVALIVVCARRRALAGWLLAPYIAWVTFAGVLNYTIVELNAPFGAGANG